MKAPLFLVLVLTFLIGCKTEEDSTMNTFINRMQSSENYTIIYNIKCTLGDDIAIAFCEESEKTKSCTKLGKVYMKCPNTKGNNIEKLIELIMESEDGIKILKRLYRLLLKNKRKIIDKNIFIYLQKAIEEFESFAKKKKIIFPDK